MMPRQFPKGNRSESGQTIALVLLILGIFLLGVVAFSVDYSNAYFHRQAAQGAADAACTAGIMDLLTNATTGQSLGGMPCGNCEGSTTQAPPQPFLCSANATAAPCAYASLNGYSASGLTANTASTEVRVSIGASCPGCPTPTSGTIDLAPYPLMQVDVTDRIPTWFTGLVGGGRTVDVGAKAVCSLQQSHAPVPIIVLNPTCKQAFDVSGSGSVTIVGGPSRSVQVNSNNPTCAAATTFGNGCSSNGTINLMQGGPNFNGSSFGVTGTPLAAPSNFQTQNGGAWNPGTTPIGDPYALVNAPDPVALGLPTDPAPTFVPYLTDGCPDHSTNSPGNWGCIEYHPGVYTTGISVQNVTAIFLPGVYIIKGTTTAPCPKASACFNTCNGQSNYAFNVDTQGVIRPADDPTLHYKSGAMFYLTGSSGAGTYGSVFFGSNAGKAGSRNIDSFNVSNFTCPNGTPPPGQLGLPASVDGNILLGQCTAGGSWVGATTVNGTTDAAGSVRGLIFFQDRANADGTGQAHMQGGGGLVISGNLYFHNCKSSGAGTNCDLPPTGYNAELEMIGTSGNGTLVLGNITADSLVVNGNGNVSMSLNPNSVYNILKASLIQ